MTKADYLAEMRQTFSQRYAPIPGRGRADFEIDLDRLIYAALAVAQEPYVRDLDYFKKTALEGAAILPVAPRTTAP